MHAMNVEAKPNNGTWEHVKEIFVDDTSKSSSQITGGLMSVIIAIFAIVYTN